MDHDIRQMLQDRANNVAPTRPTLPTETLSRARRSRVSTVVASVMSIAVLLVGTVAVADRLRHSGRSINPVGPRVKAAVRETFPGQDPRDIVVGRGYVWVAMEEGLWQLDRSDGHVIRKWAYLGDGYPRPVFSDASISVGPTAVWVALTAFGEKTTVTAPASTQSCDSNGRCHMSMGAAIGVGPRIPNFKPWDAIFRVDLRTGRATLGAKDYEHSIEPISAGPTGVWVGSHTRGDDFSGTISRYNAAGKLIGSFHVDGKPISIDASTKYVVAVIQAAGNLPNHVARIDVAHNRIADTTEIQAAYTVKVHSAQAWVVDHKQGAPKDSLIRLHLPTLLETGRRTITEESQFGFVLAVSDSAIWIADVFPPHIRLLDPITMRVYRSVEGDEAAQAAALDGDSIWLTDGANAAATIIRVDIADVLATR